MRFRKVWIMEKLYSDLFFVEVSDELEVKDTEVSSKGRDQGGSGDSSDQRLEHFERLCELAEDFRLNKIIIFSQGRTIINNVSGAVNFEVEKGRV